MSDADASEMPEHECEMPQPTAEHGALMELVGEWNVECTYAMGPGEEMTCEAKETIEPVGAFWTVSLFQSEMMGMPFIGRCTMGYDPRREVWIATWVDSMMPHMYVMEGNYDEAGKVLTMNSEGPAPGSGELTNYRSAWERLEDGKRRFEMFVTLPEVGEVKMFTHIYSRAG
jgi:hypothetical protein